MCPSSRRLPAPAIRRYVTPHTRSPRVHLLSNGSYTVMVTNAGGGYSRRQNLALTRWREDITTDAWGSFCYVRDLQTGKFWSTTHQPSGRSADEYEATFALDRAVWRRLDEELEIRTEVVVSPEDDAELRRVSITNHSRRLRTLDLTSYAEVVLAPGADLAHPAFSNLFIETIAVPERDALICVRRPRSGTERPYLIHVLSGRGRIGGVTQFETDRARFIGRGRTTESSHCARRERSAVEHHRTGPGPDRQPAPIDPPASWRHRASLIHHGFRRQRGGRAPSHREVSRSASGGARARPGKHAQRDRDASSRPDRRGHDALPAPRGAAAATAIPGCDPPRRSSGTAAARESCGSTASPAICPSCSSSYPTAPSCRCSASCSRRTSICGAKASPSISSC